MDETLLGDHRGGGGSRTRPHNKRPFFNRSDAIAHGSTYQKAAALVDLAEDGTGIPEEILDQPSFGESLKAYLMFTKFDFLWCLNYSALIVLNFFEKPLWCIENCSNRDYYFLGQLPYLTGAESLIFEGVTLLILIVHVLFPITYEGLNIFSKNYVNRLKVLMVLILIVDLLVYIGFLSTIGLYNLPFRVAPYIRVFIFILNIRDIRESTIILYGMLSTYLNVLALLLLFILFSSWIAYVIFEDTEQGKTLFYSYGVTLYHMFLLFTTSNNPDVWIPAYKQSRWNSMFFVLYVLLGVYFVTNLILAVVSDSFKNELVKQVAEKDKTRTRILKKAFNLIDSNHVGYLDKEQCIHLFEELNNYWTLPQISREDFELIFYELDDSHDVKINLEEFADLSHAIGLRFQKEDSEPIFKIFCPTFYDSYASQQIKEFIRSPTFGYIVAFILILNLVAVIIETTLDIQNNSAQDAWQSVEFVFGWIYVLEVVLKVYAYGFENYWRDGHNRFDFVITWVIVIGETATFITPSGQTFLSNGEWIRYLLIARMLRLVRLLLCVQQYRAFVATFLTLIPSLMPYLGTIFCVMCIYCSIGVQIFGGIVNAGNPDLSGTNLADNNYFLFNFNDYANGMVTLFNLLVMGNWQAWMQSYKDLTGTAWSYVYFISFYLIAVLFLLNLVVAFVLDAFFAEMELETSEKSSADVVHGEIKDTERKLQLRCVGNKSRNQRVHALLHHMLSVELSKTMSPEP